MICAVRRISNSISVSWIQINSDVGAFVISRVYTIRMLSSELKKEWMDLYSFYQIWYKTKSRKKSSSRQPATFRNQLILFENNSVCLCLFISLKSTLFRYELMHIAIVRITSSAHRFSLSSVCIVHSQNNFISPKETLAAWSSKLTNCVMNWRNIVYVRRDRQTETRIMKKSKRRPKTEPNTSSFGCVAAAFENNWY